MPVLPLKGAPIGPNFEDYDVLADGAVVGHLPIACRAGSHNGDLRRAAHGYAPTRKAAMAAFAGSWRRGELVE